MGIPTLYHPLDGVKLSNARRKLSFRRRRDKKMIIYNSVIVATRNPFVFSANGTRRVAEEQTEKIDHQAGSAVRHLPGNNGHRRL